MATISLIPNVASEVHVVGGATAVAFANDASVNIYLNTTDPSVDGKLVKLGPGDSIFFEKGGPEAVSAWFALAGADARLTKTEFA